METFDYTALLSVAPGREERSSAPMAEMSDIASIIGAHRLSKTLDQRLDGLREHFLPGGVLGGMLMKEESQGGTRAASGRAAHLRGVRSVSRVRAQWRPLWLRTAQRVRVSASWRATSSGARVAPFRSTARCGPCDPTCRT